jgi:tetratricopeptide (TPR) repeat protein
MALSASFVALPLLAFRLKPNDYAGGRSRDAGASAARNTSAIAMMFGEFRTAMSDIMYIKTERYLHSGVAYAPHMDNETLTTVGTIKDIDTEHAEASTKIKTVVEEGSAGAAATLIPTSQNDWRGFVGYLQRKVKPWRDPSEPHVLTDGREMLPWFRVMTMSDPHYARGYAVGAWWLKRRNLDAAIAFAREGITNNPSAFEIYYTLGELIMERGNNAKNARSATADDDARKQFVMAKDVFRAGAEHAIEQRPRGRADDPKNKSGWDENRESDALGVLRMAVLTEKEFGDARNAAAMARRYLEKLGSDAVLEQMLKTLDQPPR